MSILSGDRDTLSPKLDPLGTELDLTSLKMDPRGGKAGPFDGEENPQDRQNLELDPLGGTTLRCRSCLDWGTSQVQPGVDCHQIKTDVRQ